MDPGPEQEGEAAGVQIPRSSQFLHSGRITTRMKHKTEMDDHQGSPGGIYNYYFYFKEVSV
jgi:hypothetical protein